MALIKPSALVSEISGKVGEVVFYSDGRVSSKPKRRARRPAYQQNQVPGESNQCQLSTRTIYSYLVAQWRDVLTAEQRDLWGKYAPNCLSGWNYFVQENGFWISYGASILTEPNVNDWFALPGIEATQIVDNKVKVYLTMIGDPYWDYTDAVSKMSTGNRVTWNDDKRALYEPYIQAYWFAPNAFEAVSINGTLPPGRIWIKFRLIRAAQVATRLSDPVFIDIP